MIIKYFATFMFSVRQVKILTDFGENHASLKQGCKSIL